MFIVNLTYVKELSEVDSFISEHNAFLDKFCSENIFIFSVRKIPRSGVIILANVKDRSELDEIIGQDPFFKNSIARYEITEFSPTKFVPGFERLLGE